MRNGVCGEGGARARKHAGGARWADVEPDWVDHFSDVTMSSPTGVICGTWSIRRFINMNSRADVR